MVKNSAANRDIPRLFRDSPPEFFDHRGQLPSRALHERLSLRPFCLANEDPHRPAASEEQQQHEEARQHEYRQSAAAFAFSIAHARKFEAEPVRKQAPLFISRLLLASDRPLQHLKRIFSLGVGKDRPAIRTFE